MGEKHWVIVSVWTESGGGSKKKKGKHQRDEGVWARERPETKDFLARKRARYRKLNAPAIGEGEVGRLRWQRVQGKGRNEMFFGGKIQ